jgi:hypothetical protein
MPGFVRTPADEKKWSEAKQAAGKSTKEGSKSYWKLSNYIFHRMGKSGYDLMMADIFKSELISSCEGHLVKSADDLLKAGFGGMLQLSQPKSTMKTGTQQLAVKMPKPKQMPDPFGKKSAFFKHEDVKHPSVRKLSAFMLKKHKDK